jgi:hypothetical protein
LQLRRGRQGHLIGLTAADQIPADGNQSLAAFGPEGRHDVGRPRSPIKPRDDRLVDLERVQKRDGIDSQCRRLTIPDRVAREKARRAIAAQIGHEHPVPLPRQQRSDLVEGMNVVGPTVQQQDDTSVGRTRFRVSDIQHAGIDLLEGPEVAARLDQAEPPGDDGGERGTDELATVLDHSDIIRT